MLLKIDFNESQVIYKEGGRIILNLDYYSEYATGPHMTTVRGNTVEEFDTNDTMRQKVVFIGSKGGISLES